MPNDPAILPLDQPRLDDTARLFARAFADDPGFVYAVPEEATREPRLAWLYARLVGIARDAGEVEVVVRGGELVAAVAWLPPRAVPGVGDLVRHGLLMLPFRFGPRSASRLVRCLLYMETARADLMGRRPHWYLDQLAVDPLYQGQGLGRFALARGLEARLAREAAPVLLFTAKERNVAFYRGAGFDVARTDWIGGAADGFRIWAMIREG